MITKLNENVKGKLCYAMCMLCYNENTYGGYGVMIMYLENLINYVKRNKTQALIICFGARVGSFVLNAIYYNLIFGIFGYSTVLSFLENVIFEGAYIVYLTLLVILGYVYLFDTFKKLTKNDIFAIILCTLASVFAGNLLINAFASIFNPIVYDYYEFNPFSTITAIPSLILGTIKICLGYSFFASLSGAFSSTGLYILINIISSFATLIPLGFTVYMILKFKKPNNGYVNVNNGYNQNVNNYNTNQFNNQYNVSHNQTNTSQDSIFCPACGHKNARVNAFCINCGNALKR